MAKKMMLIINPVAGKGGYAANFGEAMRILGRGGYTTTLFFTSGRNDATRFAKENALEYDVVTCVGGDNAFCKGKCFGI